MKMYKRLKFIYWLRKLANVSEGEISPKWIVVIYAILCPLRFIYAHQKEINYNYLDNTITIGGAVYSMFLFDSFSHLAKEGDKFEFTGREILEGKIIISIKKIE
jgi:hypothetical protein